MRDLTDLLAAARQRNQTYVPPTPEELVAVSRAAHGLLDDLSAGRDTSHLRADFARLELELVPTGLGGGPAIAIVEQAEHRRGRGIYVFRCGAPAPARVIQIPHSFFDEGTLPIGRAVAEHATSALFVNTVHRYPQNGSAREKSDGDEASDSPQDLAHRSDTVWQAITTAVIEVWRDPEVVQLHGFADGIEPAHASALAIVSPGLVAAGQGCAADAAARLGELLGPDTVLLYPRDTKKLGATKNAQGALLGERGRGTLLHVEMSRTLRQRLQQDAGLLSRFALVLVAEGSTTR